MSGGSTIHGMVKARLKFYGKNRGGVCHYEDTPKPFARAYGQAVSLQGEDRMKRYLEYPPTLSDIYAGMFLILIGIMIRSGGSLTIQIGKRNPTLVPIPMLTNNVWIAWLTIWIGIDLAIFKGRASNFILQKTIIPVVKYILENTIGKERLNKLEQRFRKDKQIT